jgi:actin-related protein
MPANRERMTEMIFEKFKVPALSIRNPAVLSLFASGRTTGCVLESGHGVSHTVAVHEGHALPHSIELLDVGGRDLTAYLGRLLIVDGGYLFFHESGERSYLPGIKEKLTYVALDLDQELKTADEPRLLEKSYELPDGSVIILNSERFRCLEPLFDSSLAGTLEQLGVHFCVNEAIRSCHVVGLHKELYSNIVLAGGNALCPGLVERVVKEVSAIAPPGTEVKAQLVHNNPAVPYLKYSAWLGGSIAAHSPSCDTMWISKAEYEEFGASIVRRKCRRGWC